MRPGPPLSERLLVPRKPKPLAYALLAALSLAAILHTWEPTPSLRSHANAPLPAILPVPPRPIPESERGWAPTIPGYPWYPEILPPPPPVEMRGDTLAYVLNEELAFSAPFWQAEVARVLPDAVLLVVHGDCAWDGMWYALTDAGPEIMEEFVARFRHLHPDRPIVLLACNPCGYDLVMENVWHADDYVWTLPDRYLFDRSILDPETVGNIYEFQK